MKAFPGRFDMLRVGSALFIAIAFFSARGDEIRLRSGSSITGIITEEKGGVVTIDVGFGTTRIDTADIGSIARSSGSERAVMRKQWHDRYYNEDFSVPPSMKPLMEKLRHLRAVRIRAINRQRELERLDCEIDSLEHALSDNARDYQALNPALRILSKKTYEEQCRLVGKAHELNSSIISLQQTIEHKNTDQRNGNPALPEYLDSLALFSEAYGTFRKSCPPKILKDNLPAINSMESDLRQCKAEFKTAIADATFIAGNHIIVPVTINGRGPVMLLLDTGASTVTLSRSLAGRLGINWRDGVKVTATLADGQTTIGHSILLRSVAVGDFCATSVRAIVLEQPPAQGIDGLLGMSYLQRFILNIDPANKKFVMKKIIAR